MLPLILLPAIEAVALAVVSIAVKKLFDGDGGSQ